MEVSACRASWTRLLLFSSFVLVACEPEAVRYPGLQPGLAHLSLQHGAGSLKTLRVANKVLEAEWRVEEDAAGISRLFPGSLKSHASKRSLQLPADAFVIELSTEASPAMVLTSRSMRVESVAKVELTPRANAARLASRMSGSMLEVFLVDHSLPLRVRWWVELRDEAGYIRTGVDVTTLPSRDTMRAKAVILHDALHERVAVNGEGLGSVAVVDEGFFIGVEHPQAENNDGRVGSHEGGMAVRRWVPGKIDGETFFDADITSYFLPGYSLTLYLDNHHSDLPIEIKGVDIIVQDGDLERQVASDNHGGSSGHTSRHESKGNIYGVRLPDIGLTSKQRAIARFHVHGRGTYDGEWLVGLRRTGHDRQVRCTLRCDKPLDVDTYLNVSMVLGVIPPTQSRRAFLHYLERERAHPARQLLHYNSWYDIGTGQPFGAAAATERLLEVSDALSRRGVQLDAILLDDGWDDPDTGPWSRNAGFRGMDYDGLISAASRKAVGLGWWFSPFGGYHEPRLRRVEAARRAGLAVREEVNSQKVQATMREVQCSASAPCGVGEGDCDRNEDCLGQLICFQRESNVNPPGIDAASVALAVDLCVDPFVSTAFLGLGLQDYFQHMLTNVVDWLQKGATLFKVDGIGNPNGGKLHAWEDFEAATRLIAELRRISESVFINLSTGTWPSPFWLHHSDTVWRGGHDHYFAGEGTERERWMTYRDLMTYNNVVKRYPLFPLSALMTHGVIFAKDAWNLTHEEGSVDNAALQDSEWVSFRHELRTAFGSGSMLQELYLTPPLLSEGNWDDLAVAASWAKSAAEVMVDVHWVGGNPNKLQPYGWAAWQDACANMTVEKPCAARAVLTLRNPSSRKQSLELDATKVFELPEHARRESLELRAPFLDQQKVFLELTPGSVKTIHLEPFEVVVFDTAAPAISEWVRWMHRLREVAGPILYALIAGGLLLLLLRPGGPVREAERVVPNAEELRRKRLEAFGGAGVHQSQRPVSQ